VLLLGGGGYTFARYLATTYPESQISVIEIDPYLTEIINQQLDLSSYKNVTTYNEDARQFLLRIPEHQKYSLIINDASNDLSFPYHLSTIEFNYIVWGHLVEKGIYMANIIDVQNGVFLRSYLQTLRKTFSYVYLSVSEINSEELIRNTFVIVATNSPLSLFSASDSYIYLLQQDHFSGSKRLAILTDDYAPVDNLLVPVLEGSERGTD
jgi:spermidine synthase